MANEEVEVDLPTFREQMVARFEGRPFDSKLPFSEYEIRRLAKMLSWDEPKVPLAIVRIYEVRYWQVRCRAHNWRSPHCKTIEEAEELKKHHVDEWELIDTAHAEIEEGEEIVNADTEE